MTTKDIKKSLDLLKKGAYTELEKLLKIEFAKAGTTKEKANTLKAVDKYLKSKMMYTDKLKSVQLKNGKQFIINGVTAVVFKEYMPELEALPCTDSTINYEAIFDRNIEFDALEQNDILLLNNLKKYIKLYDNPIFFKGWYYNASLIKEVFDILKCNLDSLKIKAVPSLGDIPYLYFDTPKMQAVVLPASQKIEGVEQNTSEFLALLDTLG